jgi:hypothetical protein
MKKKNKRKKVKYKIVKIKVSQRQKKSLDNFCKSHKTTANKLIKKSIRHFLENYTHTVPPDNNVSVNQLKLFKLDD